MLATTALAAAFAGVAAVGQPTTGTVESHMAMAKVAAGDDNQRLYRVLCEEPAAGPTTGGPRPDPERSTWHVEPARQETQVNATLPNMSYRNECGNTMPSNWGCRIENARHTSLARVCCNQETHYSGA